MPTVSELTFSTSDLIAGMEGVAPPQTFLNTTFFPKTQFFIGRFCQVDSRKARRLLAPVVKRGQPGRVVSREAITTKFFDVPEVKPARTTTASELDERSFGESTYSRKTASERFADLVVADLLELTDAVIRRVEQMSSSLLFEGSISYLLDSGETETLAYGTVAPTIPATKWDQANSDPLGDLQSATNAIVANSGLLPDTLVLGASVMSVFLSHPKVLDTLNKLNVTLGDIRPSKPQAPGTAQFVARTYRPFLDVYGYSEAYESETAPGTLVPMVPDKSALLGCSASPATTAYGSITQTEQDGRIQTYADVKYVPRQLSVPREDYHEVRISCRPCLIPYDLASWAIINPLT